MYGLKQNKYIYSTISTYAAAADDDYFGGEYNLWWIRHPLKAPTKQPHPPQRAYFKCITKPN